MEIRAKLENIRMTARKGRLVADLVRSKPCSEAIQILQGCPRAAAGPIEKLIRSALANAQEHNTRHQAGVDLDNLYVKSIVVNEGPRMWRMRPRAMGRGVWINKASSHVSVVLGER